MQTVWRAGLVALLFLVVAGCAKYNTYYNAKRAFDNAEHVREETIKRHEDPTVPTGGQKKDYETAIQKAQKILDEYPGHKLTDDALFLQAKAYYRLESFRMSIRKLDLLFINFPATPYLEEALYIQALNYLLLGSADRSQEFLTRLAKSFPETDYMSETLMVGGDNAFAMKNWQQAASSYQKYLEEYPDAVDANRIRLKLGQCYWELKDFEEAASILQTVDLPLGSSELAVQARLLLARAQVHLGNHSRVDELVDELNPVVEFHNLLGELRLVEAENLFAQGHRDQAVPLLENAPEIFNSAMMRARVADMLGFLYLDRGDWEEAKKSFKTALSRKNVLDDKEKTRLLHENLENYLSAADALVDVQEAEVPRLKLLQANALLFGLNRPGQAAQLYIQAAQDAAADSITGPRSLYGAMLTYRDHLDDPDSSAIFAQALEGRYPRSAQAFESRHGAEGDLLGFLLDRQGELQETAYAALSEEERANLNVLGSGPIGGVASRRRVIPGLRRQLIYLSRRDPLEFAPPAWVVEALTSRQVEVVEETLTTPSEGDLRLEAGTEFPGTTGQVEDRSGEPTTPSSLPLVGPAQDPPEGQPAGSEPEEALTTEEADQTDESQDEEAEPEEDPYEHDIYGPESGPRPGVDS